MERCNEEHLYMCCDMCGQHVDACICHQCPICFEHGNPQCYLPHPYGHAIPYCDYQLKSLNFTNAEYRLEREKEDRFWDDEFILEAFNGNAGSGRWPWYPITYTTEEHRDSLLSIAIAMTDHNFSGRLPNA